MSSDSGDTSLPQSMRHKQILEAAEEHPDASVDELASMVPSATAELVERVFDEHGDPAADDTETPEEEHATATDSQDGSTDDMDASDGVTQTEPDQSMATEESDADEHSQAPETSDLSAKQREVLEAIAAQPEATQRELGEELGVSSATISNRVNSVDGFEWRNRREFVEQLEIDNKPTQSPETNQQTTTMADTDQRSEALSQLEDRVTAVEERLESEQSIAEKSSAFDDPELVHKIAHACLEADHISEDEELRILEEILN